MRPGVLLLLLLATLGCAGGGGEPAETAGPDQEEIERLRALGYVGVGEPLADGEQTGVLQFDRERAAGGLNLMTNAHFCTAQLIDMEGRLLHQWSYEPCYRWGNAVMLPNGDLVVMGRVPHDPDPQIALDAHYLMRLDWDSQVLWNETIPAHHDVELTPEGKLLTLTYRHRVIPEVDPEVPVRDHYFQLLSPGGDALEEISFWTLLNATPEIFEIAPGRKRNFEGGQEVDVFHSNSIEWMRYPELIGTHPVYGKNHVLTCIRNQDTLAIFDWETQKLVWAWGRGELSGPHDATMLPNGNVLAFDNGLGRDWSRVIEVDPRTDRIVWEYRADEPQSFYSRTRGANQRLQNGNTLITESETGRIFEVTPDGEIVWEFRNPNLTEEREPSVVVRVRRYEGLEFAELRRLIEAGEPMTLWVD